MSSLKALFGSGGGGGVPIGMYAWGNASLPDIVVDGTASYIKTGVVVSSVSYPLAPSIAIAAFQRYAVTTNLPAVMGNVETPNVFTNGNTVLALPYSATASEYRVSVDGGLNFSVASLPVAECLVADIIFASGFYFLLVQHRITWTATIWRSPTGLAGTWAQIHSQNFSGGTYAVSLAFGLDQLVFGYNGDNSSYFVRISSNPTAAAGSVAFAQAVTTAWSGSASYNFVKIRFGKIGAGPTPADDVFFGLGFQGVYYTPRPTSSSSWQILQYTAGATRSLGNVRNHQVLGQGSNWVASGGGTVYVSNESLLSPFFAGATMDTNISISGEYAIAHSNDNTNTVSFSNFSTGASVTTHTGASGVGRSSAAVILPGGIAKVWNQNGVARVSLPAGSYTNTPSQIRDDTVTVTNQQPYTSQAPVAFMRAA